MTATIRAGLDRRPTRNACLLSWVREVAELTDPDRVVWCDGSVEEWDRVTPLLAEAGAFVKHCGLPAGRDHTDPPEPVAWRPYKSSLANLLERSSEAEREASLAEALQRLRARRRATGRQGRTRVPQP